MENDKLNTLVADNIATLMAAKDLDPAKLSRKAGLNPTGIYDILKGKSKSPKVETLGKIAHGLGVPLQALFGHSISDAMKMDMLFVFENLPPNEQRRLIQTGKAWIEASETANDGEPA